MRENQTHREGQEYQCKLSSHVFKKIHVVDVEHEKTQKQSPTQKQQHLGSSRQATFLTAGRGMADFKGQGKPRGILS